MNNLPVEILLQICEILCPHCSIIDKSDILSCRRSLSALSKTTRLLRTIAQPVLFHRVEIPTKSAGAFLRMLYERPHLASCARQLNPVGAGEGWDCSDEDLRVLRSAARELLLDIDGDTNFECLQGDNDRKYFLTDLAIALLPNLQAFVIVLGHDLSDQGETTPNQYLASRPKRLGSDQPGLPNLRALGLKYPVAFSGSRHGDPGIAALLHAAPNLEQLVFDGIHGLAEFEEEITGGRIHLLSPSFRNLKVLSFASSALHEKEGDRELRYLRRIIQLCPKLEVFRFHSFDFWTENDDTGHLRPYKYIQALEPARETLEELDLDLIDFDLLNSYIEWILIARSLDCFTRLRSLRLDELSFCHHAIAMLSGQRYNETNCLTSILPQTLRFLTVILIFKGTAWNDLVEVGLVADTEFPLLEEVSVERKHPQVGQFTKSQQRAVQEAFEETRRARYSPYHTEWYAYERMRESAEVYNY